MIARSFLTAGIMLGVAGFATEARAEDPTKEQCISANEDAQSLRQKGGLQAAREKLLICVAKSCPTAIRDDCSERLNDIETAIPTIVFTAKGTNGVDLTLVKVTMDGAVVASTLDGSALPFEPGEHAFEFTTDGYVRVVKHIVLREGVKRRQEEIVFTSLEQGSQLPPVAPVTSPLNTSPEQPASDAGQSRRILAYVLGGAGIVGIGLGTYFGLHAKSTYDDSNSHCPTPATCDSDGVTGGKDASSQATISTVAFIAGGALLASGIVVFLTAPKDGGVTVQPTAGLTGAGLRLGASW